MKREMFTRCPYCHRRMGGLGILNDHLRKDHPVHYEGE